MKNLSFISSTVRSSRRFSGFRFSGSRNLSSSRCAALPRILRASSHTTNAPSASSSSQPQPSVKNTRISEA